MTEATDIAAQVAGLRAACESAADCGYVHNVAVDGRTIEWLLDQLEAERQQRETAEALNKHLDLAVRKAEGVSNLLRRQVEKSEAELAALRGEQEPVAWIKCGEVTTEPTTADVWIREMNEGYGYDVEVLCKRQPKPVVVLSDCDIGAVSHMAHWYSEEQCEAWVAGVDHAKRQMQAAGIVVKDGE